MPLYLTKPKGRKHWYIRGKLAGHKFYESTGQSIKWKAEKVLAQRERESLERAVLGPEAGRTFAECALIYMEDTGKTRFMVKLIEYFGPHMLIADISIDEIHKAGRALYADAQPSTIERQCKTPINAVLNHATGKRPQARHDNKRTRWLTPAEAMALLDACDPRTRQVVAFLLGSGCRTGNAFAVERHDLHMQSCEVWFPESKNGDPYMGRFCEAVRLELLTYGLPDQGRVFLTPKGKPYMIREDGGGQIADAFNKARDKAGLGPDVVPHVLRHTWATWFYAETKDFGGLMDRGGWRDPRMANRYRKMAPDWLPAEIEKIGWSVHRTCSDMGVIKIVK